MRWIVSVAAAAFSFLQITSVHAGTLAQFRMPIGTIDVELFDQDKPVTVQNFVRYVTSGAYSNMFIHRWDPGFVIQGGGFLVTNTNTFGAVPSFGNISNEYNVGRKFSNTYGTIAMARVGGVTNSANSQWFFNLGNNAGLDGVDGGFTVFGRVVGGTNVLNRFNNATLTNGIFIVQGQPPFGELPVLARNATFKDLVFVDISLLNVQVRTSAPDVREISWKSVSNRLNHVEYTISMPPAWKTLISTNGTGGSLQVLDADPESGKRFYRVRVDY